MSHQLASWLWDIATVLSPMAFIFFSIQRILQYLLGIVVALRKIGRVLRPAISRRRCRGKRVSKAKR
jgi:hypothetical protein